MSVVVVGVGNPDRGDDAAGLAVVEHLRGRAQEGRLPEGWRLAGLRGDLLGLLELWSGAERVWVADAMVSGAAPGTVRRLDATDAGVRSALGGFVSSHAFGLADTIELARGLGRLPRRLVVYGIEAGGTEPGTPLSSAAAAGARTVADRILEEATCTKRP